MTEVNKSNLLTQIESLISGTTLSTETASRLSTIAKTALNVGISANNVISELTNRIQTVTSSSTTEELLLFSVATSIVTPNRAITVADRAELEGLQNISVGSTYFVDSENATYIKKTDGTWTKYDPPIQANIVPNAWEWGSTTSAPSGDRSSPVSFYAFFTDWVNVSESTNFIFTHHTVGLRANGTAWAWGFNLNGVLGNGNASGAFYTSPVSVAGGFTDWTMVCAGQYHSVGLRANGTAWSWGNNNAGSLGDGTNTTRSSPVSVVGGIDNWTQLSAGGSHTVGVRANGTALAWGLNAYGALGIGSTASQNSPVSVVGGIADWVQVSAGGRHSLGLRSNGTAWAWGRNNFGQLGNGNTTNISSPVSVVGGITDWTQLTTSNYHSIGIRSNGSAWAWGSNVSGQLGDGSTSSRLSPVSVVGGFADWILVSAGSRHSVGIRANGTAWAWGANYSGMLGSGATTDISTSSPVSVVGGFTDWVDISAGYVSTTGIRGINSV